MRGIGSRIVTAAALALVLAALALVLLAWLLPLLQSPTPGVRDDFDGCRFHFGDAGIAACTRVVASGSKQGRDLARLYGNRCFKYKVKNQPDLAIADCDAAIQLDPNYAQAFNFRGLAYEDKGDIDRAIGDYSETIRLDPGYAPAYHNRGRPDARRVTRRARPRISTRRGGSIRSIAGCSEERADAAAHLVGYWHILDLRGCPLFRRFQV